MRGAKVWNTKPMRPLRGILFKLGSVMVFIAMASLVKAVSGRVPPGQAVFFRSLFAMPVIVVWLAMRGEMAGGFTVANPMGHVCGALSAPWRWASGLPALPGCRCPR